jgi:O-methyltransferase
MTPAANSYGQALGDRFKRSALSLAHRCLPPPLYQALYDLAFGILRRLRRLSYGGFWIRAVLTGDEAERRRTETVLRVMPFSLVGWRGLQATYDVVLETQVAKLDGSLVECGVAQGGSAALIGLLEHASGSPRRLFLFDSFEGLPEPTAEDFIDGRTGTHLRPLPKGSCLGTFDEVSWLLFDELRLRRDRITLVKGWFQDTLPASRGMVGAIALLRIDGDWFESVKCCLEELFDSVVCGGAVIIDDYTSCYGAQKAVDEFIASRGLVVDLIPDGRGGCYFFKRDARAAA